MLVWIGLFGVVASFHGIILGYSRQMFALSRAGYLPAYFAKVHPRFKTPVRALVGGGVVCLFALVYFNAMITVLFVVLMALAYLYFRLTTAQRTAAPLDAMLGVVE